MEYRRLGKTGLMVSAVCLGGHWKRVDTMFTPKGTVDPYRGPQNKDDEAAFLANRAEVVAKAIDIGKPGIHWSADGHPVY